MRKRACKSQALIFLKKRLPTIISVASGIGVVLTAVSASRATLKVYRLLDNPDLDKKDKSKIIIKSYALPTALGAATITGIAVSNRINTKRLNSALMSLNLARAGLKKSEPSVELVDEDRNTREDDNLLFWDPYYSNNNGYFQMSGEDFYSGYAFVNEKLQKERSVSHSDLYSHWGKPCGTYEGDKVPGWSIDSLAKWCGNYWLDMWLERTVTEDGLECYIIRYGIPPWCDYEEDLGSWVEFVDKKWEQLSWKEI